MNRNDQIQSTPSRINSDEQDSKHQTGRSIGVPLPPPSPYRGEAPSWVQSNGKDEGGSVTRVVIQTNRVSQTIEIGKRIGPFLQSGDVIALVGDLGTGKTHVIKGLAAGVGVKNTTSVSSPSFTLIHEYPGKMPFYHVDLYRLQTETEAEELGLEEMFQGRGVTAIEWADKIPSLLPAEALCIRLRYTGAHARSIEITGMGNRYQRLMKDIEAHIERRDPSAKPKQSRLTMPTIF